MTSSYSFTILTTDKGAEDMNTLKIRTFINCATCGCRMLRVKSIKVSAHNSADALIEANNKVAKWKESLKGQNCRVCTSIITSI